MLLLVFMETFLRGLELLWFIHAIFSALKGMGNIGYCNIMRQSANELKLIWMYCSSVSQKTLYVCIGI